MLVAVRCFQDNPWESIRRARAAMHDFEVVLETAQIVKQEGHAGTIAALTYTLSDIHDDAFYAGYAATLAASPNVDAFYIKDPSGLLTPERARTFVPAVKAAIGTKRPEVHLHCTIGHDVAIDDAALERVSSYWSRPAKAEGLTVGVPQDFDASFLKHQIAGGAMTTIVRQ